MAEDWRRGDYLISADPSLLDLETLHGFLRRSYWASDRSRETIELSLRHSLNFGLYQTEDRRLVGFARVVTDFASFGWIADVFIDEAYRGRGLGVWLMDTIVGHSRLQGFRLVLATRDAHGVYKKASFQPLEAPERWMERLG
jgi:GNAT superfamily N-acetyltransferase